SGYVPVHRLDRREVAALFGSGGGKGTRAVAGHDEDTTTMGVEAARLAMAGVDVSDLALLFATGTPAYADKTNATAIHAALGRPATEPAWDFGGSARSAVGALGFALASYPSTLVVTADRRDGLATSADESGGGDAGAAVLVGESTDALPAIATQLGGASATDEFLDRWRVPGDRRSKQWEEKFGEQRYTALALEAYGRALRQAGLEASAVDHLIVTSMHTRAAKAVAGKLSGGRDIVVDDLTASIGQSAGTHALLLLASCLESLAGTAGGATIALVNLADGADVVLLQTTSAISNWKPAKPVAKQLERTSPLPYGKFLSWRQMVTVEPPRRPEPGRVSATAAWRSEEWKFAFVGSKDRTTGTVHLPPSRVSRVGGAVDDMEPAPMANVRGTIVTFTIDRMVYSPSPPVAFAIVDFDGGGRFPIELTDCTADQVAIGGRVEMTFRKLFTQDDIHDYFWKARLLPAESQGDN
ncbi:MAG: OB-fold domain-containing protein, partial [Actinomycetes bacterium]